MLYKICASNSGLYDGIKSSAISEADQKAKEEAQAKLTKAAMKAVASRQWNRAQVLVEDASESGLEDDRKPPAEVTFKSPDKQAGKAAPKPNPPAKAAPDAQVPAWALDTAAFEA